MFANVCAFVCVDQSDRVVYDDRREQTAEEVSEVLESWETLECASEGRRFKSLKKTCLSAVVNDHTFYYD